MRGGGGGAAATGEAEQFKTVATSTEQSDTRDGETSSVSILIACETFGQGDKVTYHTS